MEPEGEAVLCFLGCSGLKSRVECESAGVSLVRELWTLLVNWEKTRQDCRVRLKVGMEVGSCCPGCRVAVGRPGGW